MSAYDTLLSRLTGVRPAPARAGCTRANRALCPSHQNDGRTKGRSPSLSLAETDAGAVLVHCHAGCSASDVAAAAGLDLADLFLPRVGAVQHEGTRGNGGVAAWASAAAIADEINDAAARVTAGDIDAYIELGDAVQRFKAAARDAMRAGVRGRAV
jgi:hypothetical protein